MGFEIGDRVRSIGTKTSNRGKIGTVVDFADDDVFVRYDDGAYGQGDPKYYELVEDNNSSLKKNTMLQPLEALSNLIKRTWPGSVKVLYQAGYLTKDLNITQKLTNAVGEMFVAHIIDGTINEASLGTFADELVARAKEEVAEEEAKED